LPSDSALEKLGLATARGPCGVWLRRAERGLRGCEPAADGRNETGSGSKRWERENRGASSRAKRDSAAQGVGALFAPGGARTRPVSSHDRPSSTIHREGGTGSSPICGGFLPIAPVGTYSGAMPGDGRPRSPRRASAGGAGRDAVFGARKNPGAVFDGKQFPRVYGVAQGLAAVCCGRENAWRVGARSSGAECGGHGFCQGVVRGKKGPVRTNGEADKAGAFARKEQRSIRPVPRRPRPNAAVGGVGFSHPMVATWAGFVLPVRLRPFEPHFRRRKESVRLARLRARAHAGAFVLDALEARALLRTSSPFAAASWHQLRIRGRAILCRFKLHRAAPERTRRRPEARRSAARADSYGDNALAENHSTGLLTKRPEVEFWPGAGRGRNFEAGRVRPRSNGFGLVFNNKRLLEPIGNISARPKPKAAAIMRRTAGFNAMGGRGLQPKWPPAKNPGPVSSSFIGKNSGLTISRFRLALSGERRVGTLGSPMWPKRRIA